MTLQTESQTEMTASTPVTASTAFSPSERVRHPRILSAIEDCQLMLAAQSNASILLMCGPTGVGKSTLGDFLVERALEDDSAFVANPGSMPAIRIEAPASGEHEFSWRLCYQRILNALEGELDLPRTAYGVDPQTGRVVRAVGASSNTLSGLRTAVERSLRRRGTRFIVVDEAAHMMRSCRPARLLQQLDTLKSLSNEYGVQWVLLGSYDLFELVSLSGQLARRTHVIHFGRYREDVQQDVVAFRACLKQLAAKIPSLAAVDVLRYAEVFHQNTLGCIGTLNVLLRRLALRVAQNGWSEEALQKSLLTEAQVEQILREIVEGEARIAPGLARSLHHALPTPSPRNTQPRKIA